jgi:acetate kinase
MKILVLNCGSSSVKSQLIETDMEMIQNRTDKALAHASVEKIGMTSSVVKYNSHTGKSLKETPEILEHKDAIGRLLKLYSDPEIGVIKSPNEIEAIGHRVVHGGEKFSQSTLIDSSILKQIDDCVELAPLHNPHNIKGYKVARELLPDVPAVAVFDTAFHQTMPDYAYMYGIPRILYRRHAIRRYGFHGTSHRYIAYRVGQIKQKSRGILKIITCHLGNGCSMAAVNLRNSIDTTMGFTPLEGLLMGTRSGDMDPAVILHIMAKEELGLHEANTLLNKHSGLYGISGTSNDMRELIDDMKEGDKNAKLAIDMFCYRIKKYIGAYTAAMNGLNVLAFTGGIGENAALIREQTCAEMDYLGIKIDKQKNEGMIGGKEGAIHADDSKVKVLVVPTNEELIIARDTCRLILTGDPRPRFYGQEEE